MPTLKLFKCHKPECLTQSNGRFYSEQPVCPRCQTSAKDPKFGKLIQRLVVTHFDPPTEVPGIGYNVRACDPSKGIFATTEKGVPNPWHAGTGDPTVVTCRDCLETEELKAILAGLDDEDEDTRTAAAMNRLQELTPQRY